MSKSITPVCISLLLIVGAVSPVFSQSVKVNIDASSSGEASGPVTVQTESSSESKTNKQSVDSVEASDNVSVKAGATVSDVHVVNGKAEVEGKVTGSIYSVNSDVVLEKGARIGGSVYMVGGTLINDSNQKIYAVKLTKDQFDNISATANTPTNSPELNTETAPAYETNTSPIPGERDSDSTFSNQAWIGGQLALLLLGLTAALLAQTAASQPTRKAASMALHQTSRSMLTGLIAAGLILFALAILHPLAHTGLWFIASPLLVIASVFTMVLLIFSWLCGLLALSNRIAASIGRDHEGSVFARIACMLGLIFIFNCTLGTGFRAMGDIVLIAQAGICILGLGALVANVTDFRNRRTSQYTNASDSSKYEWR